MQSMIKIKGGYGLMGNPMNSVNPTLEYVNYYDSYGFVSAYDNRLSKVRLTSAEYGEGASLTANRNRYTEKASEFMRNGGIRRLQRHGLKADGNYGKVDNLHIYYTGNRITGGAGGC